MSVKDSATVDKEADGVATPAPSTPQAAQPSGQTDIDPVAFLDNPDFVEKVRRLWQSDKDKGVARVEKRQDEVDERVAKLSKLLDIPPERVIEAEASMQRDDDWDTVREFIKSASQPNTPGKGNVDVSGTVEAILPIYGLTKDDPGVLAVLAKEADPAKAVEAVVSYAINRSKNKPPASPASIAAPPGGDPPAKADLADKSDDDLAEELRNTPPSEVKKRKELHDELRRRTTE